jgi:hypothetical protein
MASTIFSQKEIEYIKSQRLARIATAAPSSLASSKEGAMTARKYVETLIKQ